MKFLIRMFILSCQRDCLRILSGQTIPCFSLLLKLKCSLFIQSPFLMSMSLWDWKKKTKTIASIHYATFYLFYWKNLHPPLTLSVSFNSYTRILLNLITRAIVYFHHPPLWIEARRGAASAALSSEVEGRRRSEKVHPASEAFSGSEFLKVTLWGEERSSTAAPSRCTHGIHRGHNHAQSQHLRLGHMLSFISFFWH